MSSDKQGRVVFVGNIPYGLTEEQIISTLSTAGPVVSFRLVYDNDTGRPKGFGFAEFADPDAAASAVRNLDKHPIMGRELRVDFSHVGGKDDVPPPSSNTVQNNNNNMTQPNISNGYPPNPQTQQQPSAPSSTLGPLPQGTPLPPNLTCPDAISKTLATLPAPQLLDILSQMKALVMGDPAKATELLAQAPQLSYALFQALLLMGLVDTSVLASVVEAASQGAPAPVPIAAPMSQLPPRPQQAYQPPPSMQQSYTPQPQQPFQGYAPTPPVQQQAYAPPPPQLVQPTQEELLKQVLEMPQYEVDRLGPDERAQIMALKAQFGGRVGF